MAIVATENFYTIDRLLQAQPNAKFVKDVAMLGHDEAREGEDCHQRNVHQQEAPAHAECAGHDCSEEASRKRIGLPIALA